MPKIRNWTILLALLCAPAAFGARTVVSDILYRADGSKCSGSMTIAWPTLASGQSSFTATHAGTLRARNGSTLAELWNSGSGADSLGLLSKFAAPTIANGQVYVSTQSGYVAKYGLHSSGSSSQGVRVNAGKLQRN